MAAQLTAEDIMVVMAVEEPVLKAAVLMIEAIPHSIQLVEQVLCLDIVTDITVDVANGVITVNLVAVAVVPVW